MNTFMLYGGAVVLVLGIAGATVYFARSGGGAIDVSGQIRATDQSNFSQTVSPDSRAIVPNGGLRPTTEAPPPPSEPEIVPEATTEESVPEVAEPESDTSPEVETARETEEAP